MALSAPMTAGDQLNPADIEGHTLIVIPVEFQPHVPTVHTKAGEQSPAITVNVVDLSAEGGTPVVYRGAMWFNIMLINGLKRQIGQTVLGRMVKGQSQPGKNAPWQLLDVMSETDWVSYAENWLAQPAGAAFEEEGQRAAAQASNNEQVQAATAAPAGPPAAAPAARPPAPAGPPATQAAPAAPVAPPAPAAAPVAAPAGDLASQLAGLPAEEVAKMLAALNNQSQAAS